MKQEQVQTNSEVKPESKSSSLPEMTEDLLALSEDLLAQGTKLAEQGEGAEIVLEVKATEAEIASLQEAVATLEQGKAEQEARYLSLAAEFDNFRKRSRKEREQVYADALHNSIKALLPVLDSIDRALEAANCANACAPVEQARQEQTGIELIQKQALECLKALGVEEINCADASFDPNLHDAILHIEAEDMPANHITQVTLKGYKAKDCVLRHSQVIVAN